MTVRRIARSLVEAAATARARRWLFVSVGFLAASAAAGAALGVAHGLHAQYFDNSGWNGTPVFERVDPDISTNRLTAAWLGKPPEAFSVRWYGYLIVGETGQYVVGTRSDDASFLTIDGQPVVDNGGNHSARTRTGSVYLTSGPHALLIDYAQSAADYEMGLLWGSTVNDLAPLPSWRLSTNRVSDGRVVTARVFDVLSRMSLAGFFGWGLWVAAAATWRVYTFVRWSDAQRPVAERAEARRHRFIWAALAGSVLLSCLICFAIVKLWFIVGSMEGHWFYQYVEEFNLRSIEMTAISCAGVAALLAIPPAASGRREWLVVSLWLAGAFVIQGLLRSLTPNTLEQLFASDGSNSFYSVAMTYSPVAALGDFGRLRELWPLHAHSNMPGKLMIVYALKLISVRPGALAWLVIALSNIGGGVLIYVFVRDFFDDRRVALFSLVLYLFVPSKLYFFPSLNTVTPALALLCLWLYLRWLHTRSSVYAALLGVTLYGIVFSEPVALGIGLPIAALGLRARWRREVTWLSLLRHAGIAVLGFAATHVLMLTLFHFNLFDALNQVAATAAGFNDRFNRPYSIWARQNVVDFLFGIGVCQAVLFGVALADGLGGTGAWITKLTRPITVVSLALLGTLVAIDLIGVNRGEVIRLWIFLACLFQIPPAYVCAQLRSRRALMLVLAMTLLQDALGTSMIGFIMAG